MKLIASVGFLSVLYYLIWIHAVRHVTNFPENSNSKTGVVVEYFIIVAHCKQISLNFCRFSPYTDNHTSRSNKILFVNTTGRGLKFSLYHQGHPLCRLLHILLFAAGRKTIDVFVWQPLCCQRIEASSFCLFNLLGLMKCLAEFLLRLLVKTSKVTPENTDVCKAIGKNSIIQTTLLRE